LPATFITGFYLLYTAASPALALIEVTQFSSPYPESFPTDYQGEDSCTRTGTVLLACSLDSAVREFSLENEMLA
jgi:hypothetical protein